MTRICTPRAGDRHGRAVSSGITRVLAIAAAGAVLLFGGAAAAQSGAGANANKSESDDSKRVVIDRVVAVVDGDVILESELLMQVAPLLADLQKIPDLRERERRQRQLAAQVLEEMIDQELIVQAALEAKLQVQPKEIAAALEEVKRQNNLDDEGLRQALSLQGHTIASYKNDVKRQLLRMRAVNTLVRPKVAVTDEDVRARYDQVVRRSAAVSEVRLRHILIALPERPTEVQVANARARAAEAIQKARAGTPFEQLAAQYSDDPQTSASGGDLGWVERGSIATEWEVIVFSMEKGEVRGPISGPQGLEVFFVEDLKKADIKPFDELKEELRNLIYREEMTKQTDLWLEDLRKKAHIERKL